MTGFPQTTGRQRGHLRLVEQRPLPRRLDVRINVLDRRTPFGRSRVFRLSDGDLDELIAAAERLEGRR